MTPEERSELLEPGTRGYKNPIDVVVTRAEKRVTVREDGNHDANVVLHYDHPYAWHDGGHVHSIPWAALADRAVQYDLDPNSETFLTDVLEHIIYERHHTDALDDSRGLLPNGVTKSVRKMFKVDRESLNNHADEHIDVAWVKQHIAELKQAATINHAQLPAHLQGALKMNYDKIV